MRGESGGVGGRKLGQRREIGRPRARSTQIGLESGVSVTVNNNICSDLFCMNKLYFSLASHNHGEIQLTDSNYNCCNLNIETEQICKVK